MFNFIKRMFGYKTYEEIAKECLEDKLDTLPQIVPGISRCIIDIEKFKPVAIAVDKRPHSVYLRIDRLDDSGNIIHTFYDYSEEDHTRIMNDFQDYLDKQSTKQIIA